MTQSFKRGRSNVWEGDDFNQPVSIHCINSTAFYMMSYLKTASRMIIFSIWELDPERGQFKQRIECFMNIQWQVRLLYMGWWKVKWKNKEITELRGSHTWGVQTLTSFFLWWFGCHWLISSEAEGSKWWKNWKNPQSCWERNNRSGLWPDSHGAKVLLKILI